MTYFEAVSMRLEMSVTLQYRELEPDVYKEVAKKYTAEQWMECRKAILENLDKERETISDLIKLVMLVRRGGTL
jgi:hypothetical protein